MSLPPETIGSPARPESLASPRGIGQMTACRSARPAGVSSAQVVRLYEALGRSDEAANWRKELEAAKK